ncbi:MAG TPA: serine/threonine-protein kinase, partial [Terriglobia bacterium]|nr:serine/threonine-protein kinase [Terriglobia bacterium]
ATLLKRIGRLPGAKALEIARQLCAGLGAAHERGVLHRDLKPANIMIDGQGRARITDFGLAIRSEEAATDGQIVGTPAYMAPEQLTGKGATAKSDIYALGLVFYEIFTGKKAFEASTVADLRRKHSEEPPAAPSSYVTDVDPAVERVILRCLEKDPRQRPASALAVAAALPGGDPLAAALAAGETPSPELVAAAGETEGLRPALALACLGFVLAGLALACVLTPRVQLTGVAPLNNPPDFLAIKAREVTEKLGYTAPPVDRAYGFFEDNDYLRYIADHDKTKSRWNALSAVTPPAIVFWYRQSPRYFEASDFVPEFAGLGGVVTRNDPPALISGMVLAELDAQGRLHRFEAVPPQVEESKAPAPAPDWGALFSAAGLDITAFGPAEPKWAPAGWGDARGAWEGTIPARPDMPLRVEAAAFRGRPIYFQLIWPWTRPTRMQEFTPTLQDRITEAIGLVLLGAVVLAGLLLARRNLRLGRGDRRGAFRLALLVFTIIYLAWALMANHVAETYELFLLFMGASGSLFIAALIWLLYIALEPYVRRRWPQALVSWSRLLAGQFRDPLVGRHVLIGVVLGMALNLWVTLGRFAVNWLGRFPRQPGEVELAPLLGPRWTVAHLLLGFPAALLQALAYFAVFFILRMLLRKEWIAGVVFVGLFALPLAASDNPITDTARVAVFYAVTLAVLTRFGMLPMVIGYISQGILITWPLTYHPSAWYAGATYFALALTLALSVYGFHTSLGGRPIFSGAALDN